MILTLNMVQTRQNVAKIQITTCTAEHPNYFPETEQLKREKYLENGEA